MHLEFSLSKTSICTVQIHAFLYTVHAAHAICTYYDMLGPLACVVGVLFFSQFPITCLLIHLSLLYIFLLLAGISPTTIYARVGDQANFSCSHSSSIPPTGFRLNALTYQSSSAFPGYICNTYVNGVFTLFFTRTEIFSEPSVVRCVYTHCSTGPAKIRNRGKYVFTLVGC